MLKFHLSHRCCLSIYMLLRLLRLSGPLPHGPQASWQHVLRSAQLRRRSSADVHPRTHHGVMVLNSLWATTAAFVRSDPTVLYYAKNSADLETRACGHKLRGCERWCNGPLFIACAQDSGADEVEWRWHLRYHLCYILFYTLTCFCIENTTMATVRQAAVEKPDLRLNRAAIKQA